MSRIFLVDDHDILRRSLRSLLEREADFAICGESETAVAAIEAIAAARPDLVLVDVSLPDMSGIELVEKLSSQHPDLPLLMLSGHDTSGYAAQALEAGACGYVLKGRGAEIPHAIRMALAGERYLSEDLSEVEDDDEA